MRVFMRGGASALVVAAALALAGPAGAGACGGEAMGGMRIHTYQSGGRSGVQGGSGLCSVAVDDGLNAVVMIQGDPGAWLDRAWPRASGPRASGPRASGSELDAALKGIGVRLSTREALTLATRSPPEAWPSADAPDVLAVLVGLSLASRPERLADVAAAIRENRAAILGPFATPGAAGVAVPLDGYRAVVGYACLEVVRGAFAVRVATPHAGPDACATGRP